MATYKSFDQLNGKTLKEGDTLIFKKLHYKVYHSFFCLEDSSSSNDYIITSLGFIPEAFCEAAYGYQPEGGEWPESGEGDFEALTRAALLIFCMLEDSKVDSIKFVEADITVSGLRSKKLTSNGKGVSTYIKVGDYVAVLKKDCLEVGCQYIPYSTVKEVVKLAKELGFIK